MSEFNEDYYLRGVETGVSNYEDYRWLPDLTIPFAEKLIATMGMQPYSSVLDYGCARGYLVKALRQLAICAYGYDISEWAIENCDPEVSYLVSHRRPTRRYDYVIAKDVLEHVPGIELPIIIEHLDRLAKKEILIVVPLADESGDFYVRKEDNADITHKICWHLEEWVNLISEIIDGDVYSSYCISGIKPAAEVVEKSTGFILIKK